MSQEQRSDDVDLEFPAHVERRDVQNGATFEEPRIVARPRTEDLDTELRTAAKVAEVVFERGLARVERPADIDKFIRQHAYTPTYTNLV